MIQIWKDSWNISVAIAQRPTSDFSSRSIWAAVRISSLNPLFQLIKCEIWSFMKHEKIKITATKASINHLLWLIGFAVLLFSPYNLFVLQVFHFDETVAKWKLDERKIIFHVVQDINSLLCVFLMVVHPQRQPVVREDCQTCRYFTSHPVEKKF